jgi:hypothetical protein
MNQFLYIQTPIYTVCTNYTVYILFYDFYDFYDFYAISCKIYIIFFIRYKSRYDEGRLAVRKLEGIDKLI